MSKRCLFLVLLLFLSPVVLVAAPAQNEAEDGLREILLACQGAYHRLIDYRGTLRKEGAQDDLPTGHEVIEVLFRKPGYLYLRWQSGLYEGTELLAQPNWNKGNLLIKLGDWFDFITASVPPTEAGDPFIPMLKDMSEWLTALASLARRLPLDPSLRLVEVRTKGPNLPEGHVLLSVPAFLIPFRDNTVAVYEFVIERGTGVPLELVLRGAGGAVRQRLTYTDLQMNIGIPAQAFSWEERADSERVIPRDEADIDLRRFMQNWQRRYGEVVDYTGVWVPEEAWKGHTRRSQAAFKFRKPFDLYLDWTQSEERVREALFRRGWNGEKVRVRAVFGGIPLIGDLAPAGYWARLGSHYPLTEFGLNRLVERLQEQLLQAWLQGNLRVRFLGVQPHEGNPCYVLEFAFSVTRREYSSSRIVTYWDIARRLPVKYEAYDWEGDLMEGHAYYHLQLNVSLSDTDFDAANPAYGFLMFRHAPRLDRFLTGRE
jgi:outer membrane lipoprotein-sorting protein